MANVEIVVGSCTLRAVECAIDEAQEVDIGPHDAIKGGVEVDQPFAHVSWHCQGILQDIGENLHGQVHQFDVKIFFVLEVVVVCRFGHPGHFHDFPQGCPRVPPVGEQAGGGPKDPDLTVSFRTESSEVRNLENPPLVTQ
jgi:hypothetical protein